MFIRFPTIIVIGVLVFCFARRISYGVLNFGTSMPAYEQQLDVRSFLNEMILFGLGSYFCIDAIVKFITTGISIIPDLMSGPEQVYYFSWAVLAASLVEFIIALVLILGRRPILRFVGSFRTKEYGKKR